MSILDAAYTTGERQIANRIRSRVNVAKALLRWRLKLGWTQQQLAERAGTKQARISEVETLQGNLRFDTLDTIASALGLEITLQPRAAQHQIFSAEYDSRFDSVSRGVTALKNVRVASVHVLTAEATPQPMLDIRKVAA